MNDIRTVLGRFTCPVEALRILDRFIVLKKSNRTGNTCLGQFAGVFMVRMTNDIWTLLGGLTCPVEELRILDRIIVLD